MTSYAHSVIPQLDLYERIAHWVRPGGTLFVVGHAGPEPDRHCAQNLAVEGRDAFGHDPQGHLQGHVGGGAPPAAASVTVRDVVARLQGWEVIRAENSRRTIETSDGRQIALHDVVVRAVRAAGDGGEESAEQQGVVEP
ncbi:hypothetical protein [Nesterenkonia massiliensis]|uniref:hypothetical protein n=1 Tax=Nesterenkonia massiliensis TaxID=1232429 RepID=UPI000677F974|nr:hypothetical protein [Nesterenkonia massiliensis]